MKKTEPNDLFRTFLRGRMEGESLSAYAVRLRLPKETCHRLWRAFVAGKVPVLSYGTAARLREAFVLGPAGESGTGRVNNRKAVKK